MKNFAAILAICAILSTPAWADPITPNLKLIATVDGKSFFAEMTPLRNWTGANEYCTSLGMHLATITTINQTAALRNAYSADFDGDFWTSARDSHQLRQFSWDRTNEALSPEVNELHPTYIGPTLTCLVYQSLEGGRSTLVYYPCTTTSGTLCET